MSTQIWRGKLPLNRLQRWMYPTGRMFLLEFKFCYFAYGNFAKFKFCSLLYI